MAVTHALQANFSRGAISPLVAARHDKEFYAAALAELYNFIVLKYGVIRRRSGTRFCGKTKYSDKKSVLIPFVFSSTQSFFLEFGDLYIRVWTPDGELVLSGPDPVEIVTTYSHNDVERIQFVQSGDYMFLAHPSYPPKQLRRLSNTNWQFASVDTVDGPYLPINDTEVTCDPASNPTVGGSQTVTFSNASAINGGAGFTSDDVGRHIRVLCTTWVWGVITAVTNTTTVTVQFKTDGATHAATTSWRLGAIAKSQGYFGSVEFFKGRLVWSRTSVNPRATWYSMAGLPFRYDPSLPDGTVNDDHGFMIESLSGTSDETLWLKEAAQLQIGTASSIRTIGSSDDTDVFGPRSYSEDLAVNGGTVAVMPVSAGSSTVHAGRFGLSIHDLYYDFQSNGLVAPDISTLSEHLLRVGVRRFVYQQSPVGVIYALLNDGTWVGMTYERYERIIGLHEHSTREGDVVENMCAAPYFSEKRDVVMMIVKRTVDQVTERYVETLESEFQNEAKADAWFVDCGLRYDGAPTNRVTGLDHLAREDVAVFADGAAYPNDTVKEDADTGDFYIELPNGREASKILVGLPLQAGAKLLRPAVEGRDGSQHGLNKRIPYVILDLFETGALKVAPVSTGIYEDVKYRSPEDPMGQSPPLYTGTVKKILTDRHEHETDDGSVMILCDQPLPCTVRAFNVGYDLT